MLSLASFIIMRRHVAANEVYEFIKEAYPTIGKGTVYRNLDILVEEGALRKVEVPDVLIHAINSLFNTFIVCLCH